MKPFFKKSEIPSKDWNNWQWQMQNQIKTDDLCVSPFTASLINPTDKKDPIARIFTKLPVAKKLSKGESFDPLEELDYMEAPHIVHKYKDRVLFLASSVCASYCGYCTRSRLAGNTISTDYSEDFAYLKKNPCIKQVVISGGDPLLLSDDNLKKLLEGLRKIKSVEVIRIATKLATTLPMRFTDELIKIISNARPVVVSLHVSHPKEITPEFSAVCEKLNKAGVILNSQSVFLKSVNDNVKTLTELCQGLIKNYVIPYAIYSCDPIKNGKKYRVPLDKGAKLIAQLREEVSGMIVPSYFADIHYAPSKVLINRNSISKKDDTFVVLKDELGNKYKYINK